MNYPRIVVAVLASLTASLAPAAGLNGTWCVNAVKPSGVVVKTFVALHDENGALSGSVLVNSVNDLPLRDAHMEGADEVFSIDWGWKFRVRADGANLHVVVVYGGGGRQESTAAPADPAEMRVPAALPLPDLRDLPANGLAATPPMGWNSWNHFAEGVDDQVVRETADAMVASGMAAAGYTYVNIDDTWEAGRGADGALLANSKFPDMKALAAYVHAKGLKLGIYSSPGPVTCGGYPGSYGHEEQDAATFAAWGIDYLKYDWCSAGRIYRDSSLRAAYQKMGEALLRCGRPIVYSLCEYGGKDVWTWGPKVAGNLWRTTGDIQDNWKSMTSIGFRQGRLAPYAAPGHWNDPDMLEVGNGGMTPAEYRTHFSLWSMLAAPLIAGNDLRTMTDETRDILANREVIAVDQDPLGREATKAFEENGAEIWTRPLQGGAVAVGIFNRSDDARRVVFPWNEAGVGPKLGAVRDLWSHSDLPTSDGFSDTVPAHGVVLLRVQAASGS
jgi:alpha-galactosidase